MRIQENATWRECEEAEDTTIPLHSTPGVIVARARRRYATFGALSKITRDKITFEGHSADHKKAGGSTMEVGLRG